MKRCELRGCGAGGGGLELPHSTPLSTGPQWKGLGGVVIGAQPFGLLLDHPPDTHIL